MIPTDYIIEWRRNAPWQSDAQIEQDLVISRALVEIYTSEVLVQKLIFRGGTALHKLYLDRPFRYSEDLDFVQDEAEGIGGTLDAIQSNLNPWLGVPRRQFGDGIVRLVYRFTAESGQTAKLKIEINSREHFVSSHTTVRQYAVNSRWFTGNSSVRVLTFPWLLGSKLRALYQRRKGRDLFDLVVSIQQGKVEVDEIVNSFLVHLKANGQRISRAEMEENLLRKMDDRIFLTDLYPLLAIESEDFDFRNACEIAIKEIVALLPGEPWRGKE